MILLVDNYDSFSYNLYQLIGSIEPDIRVIRNDELTVAQIEALQPERIILSPGPGRPEDAGNIMEIATTLGTKIPVLGVCLGHQAICETYGAAICHAKKIMHGKQSTVTVDTGKAIFQGMEEKIRVARYHSLVADDNTMPEELEVIARDENGEIMAVKHREYDTYGLQFHPESILTPDGMKMIENFLNI